MKTSSAPNLRILYCLCADMFLHCQATISMGCVARLASAEFTFFTRLCSTGGTAGHRSYAGRPHSDSVPR